MSDGYMGAFLVLDLSTGTSKTLAVPQWLKDEWLGGKGFGAKILYDLLPAGTDALAPENPLLFLTGPLTGTMGPSMRACVVTKSPATGGYLDSFFGGRFGAEIRFAGYDGLIITGSSPTPVFIEVIDDKVTFHSADSLWGLKANPANDRMKEITGAPHACGVTIGPAGENGVMFALISCEYNRQAGRGGAGAVMGAKKLKGILISGSRLVRMHDPVAFQSAALEGTREIEASEDCQALTASGTSYAVPWSNEVGTIPFKNHRDQVYEHADAIGNEGQEKHLFLGKAACFGCPIRCSQMGAIRTGKYAHQVTDIVEYESACMIGSNLDIKDIRAVAHLVKLCDEYGMDSISAGGVIAFAIEAHEKGVLKAPKGLSLAWGDVACAESLLRILAYREGPLGELLAQGVKRASEIIEQGSEAYAMHVKGLEMPGWSVRGAPGMGLAYMTSDRGACHQRGFMIAWDVGGATHNEEAIPLYTADKRAEILKHEQDYISGTDCLVKCDFGAFGVSAPTYARMVEAATGRSFSGDDFNDLGEKIWCQTRLFNLREGLDPKEDRLPKRLMKELLPGGPHKGQSLDETLIRTMLQEYYRLRGWDTSGRPTKERLTSLGLPATHRFSLEET